MMPDSDVNYSKVKKFVKHVIIAAKKNQEKEKAKQALTKHVDKLQKKAEKKGLAKDVALLQTKLNDALKQEVKLTAEERKKRILEDETIKLSIRSLNNQIEELKEKDAYVIDNLIKQIKSLQNDLKITEQAREKEETDNRQEVQQLSQAIVDMRGRLKKFVDEKNERDKKVAEIERKIQEKVGKNYDEIVRIEKLLADMENKYMQLKIKGLPSKEMEKRLETAKQRLILKKAGVDEQFTPIIRKKPEKSTIFKRKTIPSGPIKFVKHDVKIAPVPEAHPETGKLPPIPPGPPVPKHLVHDLKKAHEIPSIWDKVKAMFGKKDHPLAESKKEIKKFKKEIDNLKKQAEGKPSLMDKIKGFFKKKPDHLPSPLPPPPPLPKSIEHEEIVY